MKTNRIPGPNRFLLRLTRLENHPRHEVPGPQKEFHVSRACRGRFQFNQALFSISGNVIFADYQAVRIFVQKMNEKRDAAAPSRIDGTVPSRIDGTAPSRFDGTAPSRPDGSAPSRPDGTRSPEKAVQAGALNAMGLIDEILHFVVSLYVVQACPGLFRDLLSHLEQKLGPGKVRKSLLAFYRDFPPLAVYQEQVAAEEHLLASSKGVPHCETALEEMLLLWLANQNQAFAPFRELFDDSALARESGYAQFPKLAKDFFTGLPPFGPDNQNLIDMLRSPALAFPASLSGQLKYIREKWGLLLGKFLDRLLSGLDLIKEDEKKFFSGPGPAAVFEAGAAGEAGPDGGEETERFSPDREWMPCLVLMAKTVYVWLHQLSKKHGRPISTLDQVPDEELDSLASCGFSGLWLIGVWERSPASRRIKQKCGNPEAMASAYSLYRYEIAADLGGDAALQNLKQRAWARGIRLASDMVPNHMGIDSPWVVEHPEWFIALDHSPFPSYRFTGEDISSDPRVSIYLEDHYYDRSDAAVVFKWVDRRSGATRYIYHGNDGTRMPWNDTAQLNYLRPDVRKAVLQTILAVARNFPIIRFDAAMTLTRKHYQRLWFPQPGTGGDIPSRAGQSLSREKFDQALPGEFWREVVERVALDAPDTLLLAEAFWLMESYFVRSLGMHRVYNSAFMNFLKMEENAKFRLSLKNVLEFNPEILKRYVNFMNNPDEETAVAQFGKGDKYFGACTLMAALPGLPMFGHGQIEGFTEKYGMEYRRSYIDERADDELVKQHERQIFPLLRRRALFSGVKNFLLYDFYKSGGAVDENVIAFSNRHEGECCLVIVHNCFANTSGRIRLSAAFAGEERPGGPRSLRQGHLGQGLGLSDEPGRFVVFRDLVSGLKYIRSSRELFSGGMFIELNAYQTQVFLDFRETVDDASGRLARLEAFLKGRGCASLERAGKEMEALPLHDALRELCRPELMERQLTMFQGPPGGEAETALWQELEEGTAKLMSQAAARSGEGVDPKKAATITIEDLLALRSLFLPEGAGKPVAGSDAGLCLREHLRERPQNLKLLVLWIYLHRAIGEAGEDRKARHLLVDEWQLDEVMAGILRGGGMEESAVAPTWSLLCLSLDLPGSLPEYEAKLDGEGKHTMEATLDLLEALLEDGQVRDLLQVNRFQGEFFFSRERFEQFSGWMETLILWMLVQTGKQGVANELKELFSFLPILAAQAEYKLKKFKKKIKGFEAK